MKLNRYKAINNQINIIDMNKITAYVFTPERSEPQSIQMEGHETAKDLIEVFILNSFLKDTDNSHYEVLIRNQLMPENAKFQDYDLQNEERIYIKKTGGPILPVIHVTKSREQLALLVLDNSGSMAENGNGSLTKGGEVNLAVQGLIRRLKDSKKAVNFYLSVIAFDTKAELVTEIAPIKNSNELKNYNLVSDFGGGTHIGHGLQMAREIAEHFLSGQVPEGLTRDVIIIIMSDGMCQNRDETLREVSLLKQINKVKIFSTYFKGPGANDIASSDLLQNISSSKSNFTETYDAETLRDFFFKSLTIAN
jgi:uncharacterized protein YegL